MLGNVMEWTSSVPLQYPGSEAEFPHWGQRGARVLRVQSYGSGAAFLAKELEIRATARILEGPDGAVDERNLYSVLGFRCAKYTTPARDTLGHRVRALERSGLVPRGLRFSTREAFGIESIDYDAEAFDMAFVRGRARAIGLAPVVKTGGELPAGPDKGDRILGLLYWSPGLSVEVELPDGKRDKLASRELGYFLAVRADSRLAVFGAVLDGFKLVGYLPSSDVELLSMDVQGGNDRHEASLQKSMSIGGGNVTLILGKGVWVQGERLHIPLRVRLPANAEGGWQTRDYGR